MLNSMNTSTENIAMAPDLKSGTILVHPRLWSIRWKIRMAFLLSTLAAGCIIVFIVYVFQRKSVIEETYNKLVLLQNAKSGYVEDYFSHLNNQIKTFSEDRQTVEAFNMLTESFLNIENDNFSTPAATSLDKMNTLLEGFYTSEIIPILEVTKDQRANLQALLPADNKQRIMQYLYLAGNSKPLNLKGTMNKADDGSAYSNLHAQYHPEFLKFARQAGITDMLLIDYKTGYVTYSVQKNLDFATSLFDGPYRNSALALAFKTAIAQSAKGSVIYTDESQYVPALLKPLLFISTPVFSEGQLAGVFVFALDPQILDELLMLDKEGLSSVKSLKAIIIGPDFLYRNNDPEFVSDNENYLRKLSRNGYTGDTRVTAERLKTTAMVQQVDPLAFPDVLRRKSNQSRYMSETGERVLCSYKPLEIDNLNWTLVTQISKTDALAPITRITLTVVIIALLILGLLYYVVSLFSHAVSERISALKDNLVSLAKGENVQVLNADSGDEIGQSIEALGKISRRITEASVFVAEMGKGNTDLDFVSVNDEDQYGLALNSLKKNLVLRSEAEEKRKKEDEIRNWTAHGIAMFNDILRSDNNDLEKLSFNITRNIIQYLSANQGGLFMLEEEEGEKYLNLVASYAYDRQKFLKKRISIGEGLAGNCVLEKKTVLLKRIPDNYIAISSGLGGSKPGCLMIVPLKKVEEVLGVLEVASFNEFKPHEVEFVEKVAESIAAALITVRLHLQTSQYLERFQQQAEEMKAQDEELRQNIEELQATHEQMERLKQEENERNEKMIKEMEDYRKLLISVINEVPEKIFLKDDKGRFIIANKPVAENYNRTVDEILGKSDFDFYTREEATEYFKHEQEIIKSGKTQSFEEGDPSKYDKLIVRSIKKPFYIEHLGITGLFGVQFDITDIKRKEYEATKLAEEINAKQKEVQQSRKLLIDILNKVPAKVFLKDENGVFVVVNKSVADVYDKSPEEIIGTSDYDNHPGEDVDSWRKQELEIMQEGENVYIHSETSKGVTRYLKTIKMPFMIATTSQTGLLGIQFDVTDLKLLEKKLERLNKEISELKRRR